MPILKIHLSREEMRVVYVHAMAAAIGGRSNVRQAEDRKERLLEDQIVGLAGNMALAKWKDGDTRAYLDMRHYQNKFSSSGDMGYDLPRCRIDVKCSVMRGSQDPMAYNLAVRPSERHEGWVYALALVRQFSIADLKGGLDVLLIGWATEDELPNDPQERGVFSGAFAVKARDLHQFVPLVFD